jgi:DNA helicase-2/ATP-dependent DNA helicase PcrA
MIQSFSQMACDSSAKDVVPFIYEKSGLKTALAGDDSPEGVSRKENIIEFLNSVEQFADSAYREGEPDKLTNFIASIQLLTDQDEDMGDERNFVTMMTVHSAKGLEFDNVFITGLEEDLFPSMACMGSAKQLEEERRLFYVTVTRAGRRLYLTYSTTRFRNGQNAMMRPSRFISEIPSQYRSGSVSSQPVQTKFVGERKIEGRMVTPVRRDIIEKPRPKIETPNIDLSNLRQLRNEDVEVGMSVMHPVFGAGVVVELDGFGSQKKAKISFAGNGVRLLLLKFAKLYVN